MWAMREKLSKPIYRGPRTPQPAARNPATPELGISSLFPKLSRCYFILDPYSPNESPVKHQNYAFPVP